MKFKWRWLPAPRQLWRVQIVSVSGYVHLTTYCDGATTEQATKVLMMQLMGWETSRGPLVAQDPGAQA